MRIKFLNITLVLGWGKGPLFYIDKDVDEHAISKTVRIGPIWITRVRG